MKKERHIWLDVIITLLTLEVMAFFNYGMRSAALAVVCLAVSVFTDVIAVRLMGRKFTADDLTVTSDALIISLMLPAVIDYRIAVVMCSVSVILKNVFGGRKNMIFSPAAVAYLIGLTSWKTQLLQYPKPLTKYGILDNTADLVNSVSHSFNMKGKADVSDLELLLGSFSGPAGAVSILLLSVSAFILIFRRDISAGAFIGTVAGTVFVSFLIPLTGNVPESVKYSICLNMVLFSAVFIIADKRIAPSHFIHALLYGIFTAVAASIVIVTSGTENAIIPVSVLFTPVALVFRSIERQISLAKAEQQTEDTEPEEESTEPESENADEIIMTEMSEEESEVKEAVSDGE